MVIPWPHFLKEDEQLLIETFTRRWTVNGPGVYVSRPFQNVKRRKGYTLGPTDYLHVRNLLTGEVRTVLGPQQFFLAANEEITAKYQLLTLAENEYVKISDSRTGVIRVERGEGTTYLEPTDVLLQDVTEGVNIDEHTAVLVRDISEGDLDLITTPQVFIPSASQEIVETRKRILLEDHQTMVILDRDGGYIFRRGTDSNRAFFLGPYEREVTFVWSTGIHKDQRNLRVTRIDSRPHFMWYEFETRTRDNVELVVGVTFFWGIPDVEKMVRTTEDVPGDITSHARSAIIQAVSQVTLEQFLSSFNSIVQHAVLNGEDHFYEERGVHIASIEVRSIVCKDPRTQAILNEIIQETTNRLNRLQKQQSENDIKMEQIKGEITAEEMRGELLTLQAEHTRIAAQTQGEAEAERVRAFFDGLDSLPMEERIAIFNTLRKQEILSSLSEGSANLYFTPADVDLSIETRTGPQFVRPGNGKH